MFIEQASMPGNKFWKYITGSLLLILASVMGQIPLLIGIKVTAARKGVPAPVFQDEILRFMDLNLSLFLLLLTSVFALVAIILILKDLHHQKLKDIVTARKKTDWNRIAFAFIVWGIFSAGSVVLFYYLEPENYLLQFDLVRFLILFFIAIFLIPIQTTVEELVFRGYLMQGFGLLAKNKWFPLLLTSLIFGGMHIFNPEVEKLGYIVLLHYIGTGLFFGIMTLMDDGAELAIGLHAANNLVAALLVTANWTAFQTHSVFKDISQPSAGWDILLPLLVIYPLLLFIFSKKYGWNNWKQKLTGTITPIIHANSNTTGHERY